MAEDFRVSNVFEWHEVVQINNVNLVELLPEPLLVVLDQKPVAGVLSDGFHYAKDDFDIEICT